MPKQSVRAMVRDGNTFYYQPSEMVKRLKNYQMQIRPQLPKGFKMFEKAVHITKCHIIFSPPKSTTKKKLKKIQDGIRMYKTTKPDLPDNCQKLALDALTGLVYKDDALIYAEDNLRKYFGFEPMIIIELKGI